MQNIIITSNNNNNFTNENEIKYLLKNIFSLLNSKHHNDIVVMLSKQLPSHVISHLNMIVKYYIYSDILSKSDEQCTKQKSEQQKSEQHEQQQYYCQLQWIDNEKRAIMSSYVNCFKPDEEDERLVRDVYNYLYKNTPLNVEYLVFL